MLQTPVEFRDERAELQSLLASQIFHRAPHLHSFLNYVCERYFQGESDQIKEYTIGVEALGRMPGFDPKKDSIVRVEAHRLRKRLHEYYATDGAEHALRIVIPNGQYVPRFVSHQLPMEHSLSASLLEPAEPAPLPLTCASPGLPATLPSAIVQRPWMRIPGMLVAVFLAALLLSFRSDESIRGGLLEEHWTGPTTQSVPAEFRMLAGYHGSPFIDQQGHTWNPDAYFTGGSSTSIPASRLIIGEPDPDLLKSERSGDFRYDIPLATGSYELRLYFAETEYGLGNPLGGGETARMFRILINGSDVVNWLDPIAEAGGANRLLVRVFKDISPAADGKLHLAFRPFTAAGRVPSPAFLNGLEVLQSKPGFIHPVRIVTQQRPLTDIDGRTWSSDQYFFGGMQVFRNDPVVTAHDKALYRGERYGNFSYHIPVAPGKYRLTLHFAETWFGTPESNEPARGSRLFNVFVNGAALLQNFDIGAEAGANREVVKVFDNLQPNAQGALWIEFVPVENYAEVNAIEVQETE